jgi:osmotically-inducible protein OsmY
MPALNFADQPHSLDDRICHALSRHPHLFGRRVSYRVTAGEVVLTGRVQTYFQKQMAQETLRNIAGLGRIVNELEVVAR